MTTALPTSREIIVDCFAGGGGASTGIEMALGRSPDVALNHDPIALAIHEANHPETLHVCQDIWQASPRELARAQGFPESYILDPIYNGKPLTKTAQVRAVGNSVCPDVAAALVRANYQEQVVERVVYQGMPLMAGAEG